MQENVIYTLKGLLTDVSVSIQQNAAIAVGKLASHSVEIAELLDKEDVLRTLIYVNIERPHRYLKRATLNSLRSIVKHNAALARSVVEMGGLEFIVGCMEEFDASLKEAAAFVLGYIARQDSALALAVVGSGCVPLLVMGLQEPEVNVRVVCASAIADIAKHSEDVAQSVLDAGAVSHLVRATSNLDPRLKRQALYALASLAKHSLYMAETVMEAEVFPLVLEHAGHTDEYIRKAACSLVKEIVKHSSDLAQMVVEAGGLGVLINSVIRNKGENRLPAILAVGFIAGHTPALGLSVIYSKGVDALSLALDEELYNHVGAAAAWALGHIGRHSVEHAKAITSEGLLLKILELFISPGSTEEMKDKAKQALKMILLRTDDLESIQPLLEVAPLKILKYIIAQYSKILPNNPGARRAFVSSGGLRKVQELLASDPTAEDALMREHVMLINACFPPDVINYFSPDYPQTLLDRVEQFRPTLNVDPSMWTDRLFSDTKIPSEIKDEIMALQNAPQIDETPVGLGGGDAGADGDGVKKTGSKKVLKKKK